MRQEGRRRRGFLPSSFIPFVVCPIPVGYDFLMRRILFILSLVLVTACTRQGTFPSVTRSASGALSSSIGNEFPFPLDRGVQRITKKPFGIFVSPSHSPIQPEKFMGYHTGTDFETFPSEKASDVVVSRI